MRTGRPDYRSIEPWPTKRRHIAKDATGTTVFGIDEGGDGFSPLIPEDEPVFILRAKDMYAPGTLRAYAQLIETHAHDGEGANAVRRWADEMEIYAADHYDGGKNPDWPT